MGYEVSLCFLTLPSPEMAILRVAARVRQELERSPSIGCRQLGWDGCERSAGWRQGQQRVLLRL